MMAQFNKLAEAMRREMRSHSLRPCVRMWPFVKPWCAFCIRRSRKWAWCPCPPGSRPAPPGRASTWWGWTPRARCPRCKIAFAVDPLVELPKVKSLEWVECEDKIVVTFSQRKDKVDQSAFFLGTPALSHINLYD